MLAVSATSDTCRPARFTEVRLCEAVWGIRGRVGLRGMMGLQYKLLSQFPALDASDGSPPVQDAQGQDTAWMLLMAASGSSGAQFVDWEWAPDKGPWERRPAEVGSISWNDWRHVMGEGRGS